MNITKQQLNQIFSLAKDYYINESAQDLSSQEFIAQCYLKACEKILGIKANMPERALVEPDE